MSEVLTEGRVSKNILSFGKEDFLFTGTVCKAWRENSSSTDTNAKASVESLSRTIEACDSGICTNEAAFVSIEEGADLSIFKEVFHRGIECWDGVHLEVATSLGRLDVMEFLPKSGRCQFNEEFLHLAVQHDQLESVKYLLRNDCPVDKNIISYRDMRSLEVAISHRNLEMVKTLRTVDYPFAEDTFRTACKALCGIYKPGNKGVTETLEYLYAEGCRPDKQLFHDSIGDGNYHAVEFMLENKLYENKLPISMRIAVTNFEGDIMRLLMADDFHVSNDVVDLATYDLGIVNWFMDERVCTITPGAYINTIEHDMHHSCCIKALEWLHKVCGFDIGFKTVDKLLQNERWSAALEARHPIVLEWFQKNL